MLGHDAAAPSVIENSPDWLKKYVRLYFRPRTPTEFRSEGIRPEHQLTMGAHRPVPIVLVFQSLPILTAIGTEFTNGNAAVQGAGRGDTAVFLKTIPFLRVYQEGALKESEKRQIVFHRCAEVLVPDNLSLANLKAILCRSQAEYESLLNWLSPATRAKYRKIIGVSAKVHFKHWTRGIRGPTIRRGRISIQSVNADAWAVRCGN